MECQTWALPRALSAMVWPHLHSRLGSVPAQTANRDCYWESPRLTRSRFPQRASNFISWSGRLQELRQAWVNGLVGAYIKKLRDTDQLGSEMTERILKSGIAKLAAFNHVRNNHTLAHDNTILSYDEALLIFNHVASTVRFVKACEANLVIQKTQTRTSTWGDELPF